MSGAARIRAFLAVDLESAVHAALVRLKHELAAISSAVRWVGDAGLHVTVKFLGAVEPAQLDAVHTALLPAVATFPAFRVSARGLGVFPTLRRPRVVWVGLQSDSLAQLAGVVEDAVAPVGFPAERRPFRAHITLGRIDEPRAWAQIADAAQAHWTDDFGASEITTLNAYRSDLRRTGAVYTKLWTIELENSRGGVAYGVGR